MVYLSKIVIFHGYVKQPDGSYDDAADAADDDYDDDDDYYYYDDDDGGRKRKRKRRRTATMPTVMIACITRMRRAMVLVTWWSFHGLSSYAPSPCAFGGESLNSVRTSNPQQVTRPSCDVSPIPSFGTCWHTPEKKYDLTMFWPLPNLWDIL